jgi:cell division protein ZapA
MLPPKRACAAAKRAAGDGFVLASIAMAGRTVQLRVGGHSYRVVTSATDDELQRLTAAVEQKLATVVPAGKAVPPHALLLAAMALAHDLEEERSRSRALAARARGAFGQILQRVDAVLGQGAAGGDPSGDAG